jgi:hypothetical protein
MKFISAAPINRQDGCGIFSLSTLMPFQRVAQLIGSPTISATGGWLSNYSGLIGEALMWR